MCSVFVQRLFLPKKPSYKTIISVKTTVQKMFSSTSCENVKTIFQAAVSAVEPRKLIENCLSVQNGHLIVKGQSYELQKLCHVVAFGKAVLGMCVAVESVLDGWIKEGVATVPTGIFQNSGRPENSRIRFLEGAKNNLPDEEAYKGALQIKELAQKLQEDDLLIVLVSGGGSALLPLPKDGVSLQEKMDLIKKVANKGADIIELAKVRKCLSQLKGGGLAEVAYPAKVVTLILSDVVGDPLDYIAGGPTVPNTDVAKTAINVLEKRGLLEDTPASVKKVLKAAQNPASKIPISQGKYLHVDNYLIGNNVVAIKAAEKQAIDLGYETVVLSTHLQGEVTQIARFYALLTKQILHHTPLQTFLANYTDQYKIPEETLEQLASLSSGDERLCILGAGEPSVVVRGNGKGGRNQQLALEFSVELNKFDLVGDITFLSCGTDGIDGPTDAAGAIGSSHLVNNCVGVGINPVDYLRDNDSYGFYSRFDGGSHLVKVGHTGTNVMDVHVILIDRKK